ncbi:MAG: helix-hairpin-helix domain-containing protein [Eubacterium sp.]|nr:helix-hairpin-helix domain-containing protein [Eubacterium sp.]
MRKIHIFVILLIIMIFDLCGCGEVCISTIKEDSEENTETTIDSGYAENEASDTNEVSDTIIDSEETVVVYICGAVVSEGVYTLSYGSRVVDVLDMAGGYKEDAAKGYVNLAEPLSDGDKIYIPFQDEVDDEKNISQKIKGKDDIYGSGDGDRLVNINKATRDELMTLPGIGGSKADDIISYREEHGKFSKIEDLMNISGIKTGVFNKIKDMITI